MVDTSTSTLTLHVGVHRDVLSRVRTNGILAPENVMIPEGRRSWVALSTDSIGALTRAHWGAEEMGLHVGDATQDIVSLTIVFNALGYGHYHLTRQLEQMGNGRSWRFHGSLLLADATNSAGQELYNVDFRE
jgi:hypothetical protein